ncbi:hypothetical protein, variant [Exophiala mesophila]|uniref:Rhodopsin domain-containing protein n=1 Tax=Exophiala mesophila TaxID=212818 RepID=A0A0D1ZPY3_EXOME|nr:uncharacterized protein PV10_00511 [Exophiala mesophila]XP_016228252.1 hypothetical protein, variant [Exophiala mesophila]KIV96677.1 hypothetical protein PV10_00511 [Exophiala mesophila]KIV96678.1 hypothetical protein, variant [Exophiala mesophila]
MATVIAGDRFSRITPDDHAGSLWIASLLCLVYSVITLALRGHLRWKMYGPDDYLATVATALHIGEVVAIIIGLQHGLGQTQTLLRESDIVDASKATFAAQILFILSAAALKAATLYLMMRLFNLSGSKVQNQTRSRYLYWTSLALLALMALWGVSAIVAVSVNCSVPGFIEADNAGCTNQFVRWQIITALDVFTECMLVLFSVFIVWPVQLSLALKTQVVAAFAFRLPVAALSLIHLHYVSEYTKSDNVGLAIVPVLVLQQVQLCWSLISATIPNLKSFVKSFSSGFGIQLDPSATRIYGSSNQYGRNNGYELGSVRGDPRSKSRSGNASYNDIEGPTALPQDGANHKKHPNGRDEESIHSGGSQDHIIRKDVQWKIHYENAEGQQ